MKHQCEGTTRVLFKEHSHAVSETIVVAFNLEPA